jgi:hypothetical protein
VVLKPVKPDRGLFREHYADSAFKWLFWLFPEAVLFVLGLRSWGKMVGPMSTDYFVDDKGRQIHPDCVIFLEDGSLGFIELDNQGKFFDQSRYGYYVSAGSTKYAMDHDGSLPVAHAALIYTFNCKDPRLFNHIELSGTYAYTPETVFLANNFLLNLDKQVEDAERKAKAGINPFARPVDIVRAVLAVLGRAEGDRAGLS